MSKVGDFFFEFPASLGCQGNTSVLLMSVPGRVLTRVLASDHYGHALERSQREINQNRVKKFYDYLVQAEKNNEPFIVPPLVGNCDSEIEFEPFGNTNVGVVRFPMDAEIRLFDGQHRAAGIEMFCRNPASVLIVPLMLTRNLSLKTRQQFFSDINNNASKPSASINLAYNGRDDVAQGMVAFLSRHDVFTEITDFEHNVVPAKSNRWVSFKALCDATAKFARTGGKQLEMGDIESIWESWLAFTQIETIRHGTNPAEYKRDYIQFHAVMINAFGYAVQHMMADYSVREIAALINEASAREHEDLFLISNWSGVCANTDKDRSTVIANVQAQKATAMRLVGVFASRCSVIQRAL
ncbi:TPA: DGQHR domain-containing protein [Escherichia coli]